MHESSFHSINDPDPAAALLNELPPQSRRWHRASAAAPDTSKVFEWRSAMSAADRIVFDDAAGDALEQFDYERVRRRHSLGSFTRYARYCLVGRY